jgi:hypothetical protein
VSGRRRCHAWLGQRGARQGDGMATTWGSEDAGGSELGPPAMAERPCSARASGKGEGGWERAARWTTQPEKRGGRTGCGGGAAAAQALLLGHSKRKAESEMEKENGEGRARRPLHLMRGRVGARCRAARALEGHAALGLGTRRSAIAAASAISNFQYHLKCTGKTPFLSINNSQIILNWLVI